MRSATLPGIESTVAEAASNNYRGLVRAARTLSGRISAFILARRNERYSMRHEHLLRGPLADEVRRASWL